MSKLLTEPKTGYVKPKDEANSGIYPKTLVEAVYWDKKKMTLEEALSGVGSSDVWTEMPEDGFKPNTFYNLGTITEDTTFLIADGEEGKANHYFWVFETGANVPEITWPEGIRMWENNEAPVIAANKHYEISVYDGVGMYEVIGIVKEYKNKFITWDGDTTGLEHVELWGMDWYKLADWQDIPACAALRVKYIGQNEDDLYEEICRGEYVINANGERVGIIGFSAQSWDGEWCIIIVHNVHDLDERDSNMSVFSDGIWCLDCVRSFEYMNFLRWDGDTEGRDVIEIEFNGATARLVKIDDEHIGMWKNPLVISGESFYGAYDFSRSASYSTAVQDVGDIAIGDTIIPDLDNSPVLLEGLARTYSDNMCYIFENAKLNMTPNSELQTIKEVNGVYVGDFRSLPGNEPNKFIDAVSFMEYTEGGDDSGDSDDSSSGSSEKMIVLPIINRFTVWYRINNAEATNDNSEMAEILGVSDADFQKIIYGNAREIAVAEEDGYWTNYHIFNLVTWRGNNVDFDANNPPDYGSDYWNSVIYEGKSQYSGVEHLYRLTISNDGGGITYTDTEASTPQ